MVSQVKFDIIFIEFHLTLIPLFSTFKKQELNITPKPTKNMTKEASKATQAKKTKEAKDAKRIKRLKKLKG